MIKRIMSDEEQVKISEAVAEAEKSTSGEIVPMIVGQSDDYPDARWRIAVVLSLLTAFTVHHFRPDLTPLCYLWAQIPALFIGYTLGAFHPFLRPFLVRHKVVEEVRQRALVGFHTHGLSATRDRTGILIFISLLERRVEIFADSGIHAKVPQETWNLIVRGLVLKIREGQLTEGLRLAITECGVVLRTHFPAKADDSNELPNQLILEP